MVVSWQLKKSQRATAYMNNTIFKNFSLTEREVLIIEQEARRRNTRSLSAALRSIINEWYSQHNNTEYLREEEAMTVGKGVQE